MSEKEYLNNANKNCLSESTDADSFSCDIRSIHRGKTRSSCNDPSVSFDYSSDNEKKNDVRIAKNSLYKRYLGSMTEIEYEEVDNEIYSFSDRLVELNKKIAVLLLRHLRKVHYLHWKKGDSINLYEALAMILIVKRIIYDYADLYSSNHNTVNFKLVIDAERSKELIIELERFHCPECCVGLDMDSEFILRFVEELIDMFLLANSVSLANYRRHLSE